MFSYLRNNFVTSIHEGKIYIHALDFGSALWVRTNSASFDNATNLLNTINDYTHCYQNGVELGVVWGEGVIKKLKELSATLQEYEYPKRANFAIKTYKCGENTAHWVTCFYGFAIITYAYIVSGESGMEALALHMGLRNYMVTGSIEEVSVEDYEAVFAHRVHAKHIFEGG